MPSYYDYWKTTEPRNRLDEIDREEENFWEESDLSTHEIKELINGSAAYVLG